MKKPWQSEVGKKKRLRVRIAEIFLGSTLEELIEYAIVQFIKETSTNPLLKHLMGEKHEKTKSDTTLLN